MFRAKLLLAFVSVALGASLSFAQDKQSPTWELTVSGEVAHPLKLTAADFAKLPHQKLTTKDTDGKTVTFDGTPLVQLLQSAGVEFGEKLRGTNLALFLVVEAADGYKAVFALPELDPAFNDRTIIVAESRDGKPLSDAEGHWRVVVPDEKRHGRWVRQVISLTVRRA
jgi:DMSO/TMAO reductase YedYZ molybdopterin-dependent catalytic subunit